MHASTIVIINSLKYHVYYMLYVQSRITEFVQHNGVVYVDTCGLRKQ